MIILDFLCKILYNVIDYFRKGGINMSNNSTKIFKVEEVIIFDRHYQINTGTDDTDIIAIRELLMRYGINIKGNYGQIEFDPKYTVIPSSDANVYVNIFFKNLIIAQIGRANLDSERIFLSTKVYLDVLDKLS